MHFIIFSLLLSVSSVLASHVPLQLSNLEALASCETKEDFFNNDLKQTLALSSIRVVDDNCLDALLQNGTLFTISTFFQFRLDTFINDMRNIRAKINNDRFYTALLFSLIKGNPIIRKIQVIQLVKELGTLYKDNPESVGLFEFQRGLPKCVLDSIGFRSLYVKNYAFVDKMLKEKMFILEDCPVDRDSRGFRVSTLNFFTDIGAFQLALAHGYDFSKPIIQETKDGDKEVTIFTYICSRFSERLQITELLWREFNFPLKIREQAYKELAEFGIYRR